MAEGFTVTAEELKMKREALGLTPSGLADKLCLGVWGYRRINDYEAGRWPVPQRLAARINEL